jgi:hypothetical protein
VTADLSQSPNSLSAWHTKSRAASMTLHAASLTASISSPIALPIASSAWSISLAISLMPSEMASPT